MKQILIALIFIAPFTCIGQNTAVKHPKHKHRSHKTATASKLPPWAAAHNYDATAHVYFPDYYTFYDPKRGGYVYWDNGKYVFSPSVPAFMEKVDLGKTQIRILKGLSLDLYPELDYPNYMKLYPPTENGNDLVPVPTITNR